jgi:hypothetical protein
MAGLSTGIRETVRERYAKAAKASEASVTCPAWPGDGGVAAGEWDAARLSWTP